MKITMKTCLALLLILLPIATSHAADNDPSSKCAKALAEQISHITNSPTLTLEEKDARVSTAVRTAVSGAIAKLTDPAEILKATEAQTTAAAQAAPDYTHAILAGVSTIPAITAISGATDQVQTANVAAAATSALVTPDTEDSPMKKCHVSPCH
jgi:DNA-binding NarL/FixJ family response regulator